MENATLAIAWAEACKLRDGAAKFWDEENTLMVEGDNLRAAARKLWSEGDRLRAAGDKLWCDAVCKEHGDIAIEWRWNNEAKVFWCVLANGEVYVAEVIS